MDDVLLQAFGTLIVGMVVVFLVLGILYGMLLLMPMLNKGSDE